MSKSATTGLACIGLFVLSAVAIVVGSIMEGWVLSKLWGWFVSPLFGVPSLSIAAAIGFALVISMLTHQSTSSDSNKDKDWTNLVAAVIAKTVFTPLMFLLFGYIVKMFM
jgi:hypothetical protein